MQLSCKALPLLNGTLLNFSKSALCLFRTDCISRVLAQQASNRFAQQANNTTG